MLLLWNLHTSRAAGKAAAMLHLPHCGQSEAGNTQQQILPGKLPLHWPTVQLQNICPSASLGPNQGNPEYSIAGADTVGKWCGPAVKNTIAHLLFTEHLLQGRTTSQRLVLPRPLKLNSYRAAPGVSDACSMPGTCSRYFETSSCTGNRIPKCQAGVVKRELLFFKSFLLALFWLSLLPLSPLFTEDTEFK